MTLALVISIIIIIIEKVLVKVKLLQRHFTVMCVAAVL